MNICKIFLVVIFALSIATAQSPYQDLLQEVTAKAYPQAHIVTVFDWTTVTVENSGLAHTNVHTLTKVLTNRGAIAQSVYRFDYDAASNMIVIKKAVIHRADGTMETVELATAVDGFAPAHMIYWGGRMKLLGIPNLKIGDAVEIAYYKKGFMIAYLRDGDDDSRYIPPMYGHYYDTIMFGAKHPIKHKIYTLKTPKDKPVQFEVYNGNITSSSTFDDQYYRYVFCKRDIPAYAHESSAVDAQDYIPKVVLATVKDWYEKSKWFYHANEDVVIDIYNQKVKPFEFNEEIRRKALEITADYKTDREKRWAILHWVAQHIRYSGISMGKGEGYTLHPAIMTFRDRCGVCKDIAGMALTMFRALGYKAYPTMTMAGSRVEQIPADQFNHCVVAVDISSENIQSDNLPGTKWEVYDPTWAPNSMDIWSRYEGEQHVVIGAPPGEDLMKIRPYAPRENRLTVSSTATINANGDLLGTLKFEGAGVSDARLRKLFAYGKGTQYVYNRVSRNVSKIDGAAKLVDLRYGDFLEFSAPMFVEISYRIPGYALRYGDGYHFVSPAAKFMVAEDFVSRLPAYARAKERKTPLLIWAPRQIVIEEEIAITKPYKRLSKFEEIRGGGDFANFRGTVRQAGKAKAKLLLSCKYTVGKRVVTPEQYPQLRELVASLKKFAATQIHIWSN